MSETSPYTETPEARPWRPQLGRRSLILASMAIIGAGLYLNWGWVTAIGAAPLILAVAPCAIATRWGAIRSASDDPATIYKFMFFCFAKIIRKLFVTKFI